VIISDKSIGILDLAVNLSVSRLTGLKIGFTNLPSNSLTGCIGSKNHDSKAFAIIINDKILKNHINPVKMCTKTIKKIKV